MPESHPHLTVILPTHNEMSLDYLRKSLEMLCRVPAVEVLCVDLQSTDGTTDLIRQFGASLVSSHDRSRSRRFNAGLKKARAELILFHHPRSYLSEKAVHYLLENKDSLLWGGFRHRFDVSHPLLKFTSWYSNTIRPATQKIVYLDHCIFVHKDILSKLSSPIWPETDIFEDTDFCKKLSRFAKPQILPFESVTSAVRFQRNGLFRQALKNQILKLGYVLGVNRERMENWYEKGLFLNSRK